MQTIQYHIDGDIFTAKTQVIVNPVNCQGIMGKGLALAFKQRYPHMFQTYQQECRDGILRIGQPTLYTQSTPWILNFPTKDKVRADSQLSYIDSGLAYLAQHYKTLKITSIAFPKLGTGLGRLTWNQVGPLMVRYLVPLDLKVHIYINDGDTQFQYEGPSS